ncbi:MAG TPA: flavin reductase family protein [Ktedonobacterales bacterium]|nr:flavin reductase family protein [Ktedonobacterales bacterium]
MSVESRILDTTEFRRVLGRFTTGVTVVTTCQGNRRAGITVNAFTSVSLEPPLVLVCVERRSYAHDLITASGIFAVNLLSAEQADVSRCFAGRSEQKFARFCGVTTHDEVTGAPVFDQCAGFVDCRLEAVYPGGDHSIFLGRVVALGGDDVPPLLYYRGKYGQLYENELELGPSVAPQ